MKLLTITIISLLTLLNTSPTYKQTIEQTFPTNTYTTSLLTQLDGNVELIRWDQGEIKIETTISSNTNASYSLDYVIDKGSYELVTEYDDAQTIIIRSKKINTYVFTEGQLQKTRQHYRVFLPKSMTYEYQ
ncbi:MAG: hypothetical protein AAFP19_25065 [Bacteroidota bacterium]